MPSDLDRLKRDEREATRMRGDSTRHFGRTRRGRGGGRGIKPTDPDYFEKINKQYFETNPAKIYSLGRDKHWYVFGVTIDGKPVVLGPEASESEALERGAQLDQSETFELQTRDLARATREIKHRMLERHKSPDEVLTPYRHSVESTPEPETKSKSHWLFGRRK